MKPNTRLRHFLAQNSSFSVFTKNFTLSLGLVVSPLLVSSANAQTWDGSETLKNWSDGLNWVGNAIPTTGGAVLFTDTGAGAGITNIVNQNFTIGSLRYSNTSATHTTQISNAVTLTLDGAINPFLVGGVDSASSTYNVVINGSGTLSVANAATTANFLVGVHSTGTNGIENATLDMSGLSTLSVNIGGSFAIGSPSAVSVTAPSFDSVSGVAKLASNSTITAGSIRVGDGGNADPRQGNSSLVTSSLQLGTTNTLYADSFVIGAGRTSGELKFQTGLTGAAVTIGNTAGTGGANLTIGVQNVGTGTNTVSTVDFSGGTVAATLGTVNIGGGSSGSGGSNNGDGTGSLIFGLGTIGATTINVGTAPSGNTTGAIGTGTVTMNANAGTLTAGTVVVGLGNASGNKSATGTFAQNGGTAAITTLTIGDKSGTGSGAISGTYNLAAGTLKAGTIQAGADTATRTFTWTGGTIQNLDSSTNLAINTALTLTGANSQKFTVDSGRTTTVNAGMSGTGRFSKDGQGTLILTGTNTYSGTTTVTDGILKLAKTASLYNSNTGSWTASNILVGNGGTLDLNVGGTGEFSTDNVTTLLTNLGGLGGAVNNNGLQAGSKIAFDTTNATGGPFTVANNLANSTGTGTGGGAIGVTKVGTGTLTLSGNNTYSGGTALNAGTLVAGSGTALGNGTLTMASGTTLSSNSALGLGGVALSGGANIILGSATSGITATGVVSITGTGNLLTVGGTTSNNTYALLSGNNSSVFTPGSISITGTAVGGATVALGGSTTIGRTTYALSNTSTALLLDVTGGAFNLTWNGGNATWNEADPNWQKDGTGPNITFVTGDNITIGTADTITVTGGGVTAGTVLVNNTAGTAVLTGGALTSTSLTKSGAGTLQLSNTINASLIVNEGVVDLGAQHQNLANVTVSGGSLTGTTGVLTGTGPAFDIRAGSVSAILGGSVGLNKTTGGTATLSGANTYTGLTTVSAGELQLNRSGGPSIAGNLTVNGGVAKLLQGDQITNTRTLTVSGGTFDLGANNQSLTNVSLTSGTITGTSGVLTGLINALDVQAGSISAILGGNVDLNKTGLGTVVLSGSNTYTGSTNVKNGSLVLDGGTNRLLSTGSVVIGDTGTIGKLVLGGTTTVGQTLSGLTTTGMGGSVVGGNAATSNLTLNISGTNTFAGVLGGAGTNENNLSLTKNGVGTLTLSNSSNTFSGGIQLNAGILTLSHQSAGGAGTITAANGTTINPTFATNNTVSNNITLSGTNANVTLNGANSGGGGYSGLITGTADQTLTINGTANPVNFNRVSNQLDGFYGTVSVAAGSFLGFRNSSIGFANGGTNALFEVNGSLSTRNDSGSISLGALSGSGTVAVGGTSVSGGTGQLDIIIGARNSDALFSGAIQNGSTNIVNVVKTGSAVQTFSGTNLYTGTTTVNSGKLVVSGSIGGSDVTVNNSGTILASGAMGTIGNDVTVNSGAILAAGDRLDAGMATATGATTLNNDSIFSWDISSNGLSYDKLVTTGLNGDVAEGNAVFQIVAGDATFADAFWSTSHTWTDIFTTDGTAAIADWAGLFSLAVVDNTFASITPVNGSFTIDGSNLTWSAVPEPSSALAGLLIGAGLLRRRRQPGIGFWRKQ